MFLKISFLNEYLTKSVYITHPPYFVDSIRSNHVCKLQHFFYGLKQSLRAWFNRQSSFLFCHGFCLQIWCFSVSLRSIWCLHFYTSICWWYVDDIIVTGNSFCRVSFIISTLQFKFGCIHADAQLVVMLFS